MQLPKKRDFKLHPTAEIQPPAPEIPRVDAELSVGLTAVQVAEREAAGLTNGADHGATKTEKQIIYENIFTFFNLVFLVLAVCLGLVGSFANMGFLGIVVCNTVIGIVQQLRSKRTVDQLTLVSAHKVRCIRDGKELLLPSDQLVRDDLVEFTAGEQICADAVVRSGTAQANEALITGEANAVAKAPGDALRSGSFLLTGRCWAQLTAVGADSYANRLAAEAKAGGEKVNKGEMMRSLDRLIQAIGIVLIPMGMILFYNHWRTLGLPLRDSVESTVAALIGMIPEGLYLLTSVALAVSMVRLARQKVLAQDMNCIETLARVDVLCVDKTGTITESRMQADAPILLDETAWPVARTEELLANFYADTEPDNDTARALTARFCGEDAPAATWQRVATVPFQSAYKWSAATFAEQGSVVIGAPDFVAGARYGELTEQVEAQMHRGVRVLLAAQYDGTPDPETGLEPAKLHWIALLPVNNRVRPEAPQTFRYFAEQGVAIKVISGDNPLAVSEIAHQAGIEGAEQFVDGSALTDEALQAAADQYTVFGRVTPDQKRKLVKALQAAGHTVAMTGDGVNDVLALKDADCGIAMASGAQAASQVAQLVLLESDFSGLPSVVAEGRRVINNIQRSASLFLVKNIFSFLLSLVSLFVMMPYPLQPLQLSLISAVTIGIPSFILALEPNHERIKGRFLPNVLRAAAPGGLSNLLLVLGVEAFVYAFDLSMATLSTITTVLMLAVGMAVLWRVCKPFTPVHAALWGSMLLLGIGGVAVLGPLLDLTVLDLRGMLVLLVFLALVLQTLQLWYGVGDLSDRLNRWFANHRWCDLHFDVKWPRFKRENKEE